MVVLSFSYHNSCCKILNELQLGLFSDQARIHIKCKTLKPYNNINRKYIQSLMGIRSKKVKSRYTHVVRSGLGGSGSGSHTGKGCGSGALSISMISTTFSSSGSLCFSGSTTVRKSL